MRSCNLFSMLFMFSNSHLIFLYFNIITTSLVGCIVTVRVRLSRAGLKSCTRDLQITKYTHFEQQKLVHVSISQTTLLTVFFIKPLSSQFIWMYMHELLFFCSI